MHTWLTDAYSIFFFFIKQRYNVTNVNIKASSEKNNGELSRELFITVHEYIIKKNNSIMFYD